jgi:hypothetical protein
MLQETELATATKQPDHAGGNVGKHIGAKKTRPEYQRAL